QISQLADQGNMVSVPGPAHYMGGLGHLLFEPAVRRIASCDGDILCSTCDMAALDIARTTRISAFHRIIPGRGCLVDIYSALARSAVAPGSRGDATGEHRWRPRAYYRRAEFRIP